MDDEAQIISYEEYTSYGSTSYQAVRSHTEKPKRYRYTGKERDEESGFYYFGARYYSPWVGKWVNCDPIGTEGGINLYEFANDNPVRFIDKIGHQANSIDDLLTFLHAQAGFEAGASRPFSLNPRMASPAGTARTCASYFSIEQNERVRVSRGGADLL